MRLERLQLGQVRLHACDDRRLHRLGIDRVQELQLLDLRGRLQDPVRELVGLVDRGVQHRAGFLEPTLLRERFGGVQTEAWALRMAGRQQRGRALQEVRGRRDVASGQGAAPGRGQVAAPTHPDLPHLLVVRRELLEREEGLLEVVAPDLLELEDPVGGRPLEPVDEPHVQVGTGPFQQPVVRGLADQDVHEAVGLLAGEARFVRHHELAVGEVPQALARMAAHLVRREVLDGPPEEDLADHRRPLHDDPVDRAEPVEARG